MTLFYFACAWLLGIYLASLIHLPVWSMGVAIGICLAISVVWQKLPHDQPPRARTIQIGSLCFLVLFLGLWRYELARPTLIPGPLAAYNDGERVTLQGIVVNEPVARDRSANLQVRVTRIKSNDPWVSMPGQVLVQVPSYTSYRYGDELELYGKLQTPRDSDGFSYRTYLARKGIHSLLSYPRITLLSRNRGNPLLALLYALKRRTQSVIAAILPEPEAALLTGILLGSDEGIPRSLMEGFRATGTAHIIAISGFNIALISATLVKVFSCLLPRYTALVCAIGVIACYAILVGAEPPVVRAAIMGGLAALALIAGRQSHALTSLFTAAWWMTIWQPFLLWDVSFQLSFAASLGLIVYAEKLQRAVEVVLGRFIPMEITLKLTQWLNGTLLATLAAMITTLPLLVYHFQQFSLLSLVANLLILPVQPMIVYLGSTAAVFGLVSLSLGRGLGWATWLCLTYTTRTVKMVAQWMQSSGTIRVPPLVPLAYYAFLLLVTWRPIRTMLSPKAGIQRLFHSRIMRKGAAFALAVGVILVWLAAANLPDGKLHVLFLDVGQGDAILVQTPAGSRLLIDGGPSPALLLSGLGRRLPFWDRRIDFILLSHPHEDHLLGLLSVVERYQVRQVLMSGVTCQSPLCAQWQQLLQTKEIPVLTIEVPMQVDLDNRLRMEILPPVTIADDNLDTTSLVARLSWQETSFLFAGDLEAEGLLALHDAGWELRSSVLKVAHHGSNEAVNEELLAVIEPEIAVISVGTDNRFGHPAATTLSCLAEAGIQVLRTDQVGTVEIITDGRHYQVRTGNAR